MGLNEWLTLIGSMGGLMGLTEVVKFWLKRNSMKKQADAEATHADLTNLNAYADNWKELYTEAKGEIKELNAKIDSLYDDIKILRECKAEHVRNEHRLELENEVLKIKKCDIRGCSKRQPPSDY